MTSVVLMFLASATAASAVQISNLLGQDQRGTNEELAWPFPFQNPFNGKHPDATRVQKLDNDDDVAYYGAIYVGGQKVKAVVDTGSFELLVFGKNCSTCGGRNLYDHDKTKVGNLSDVFATHTFGSGTADSLQAFDKLEVGGYQVPVQQFWEVTNTKMDFVMDGSFQAILGVGPPESALKMAEFDAEQVQNQLSQLGTNDKESAHQMKDALKQANDMVGVLQHTTGVVQNVQVENLSFCFGHKSGSAGHAFWNDHATRDEPSKFLKLDVVGDFYWSAKLGAVRLQNAAVPENASRTQEEKLGGTMEVGCKIGNCSVIIDTGTSLIAAPSEAVDMIYNLADEWEAAGGTCDDVSKLPELRFALNGEDFYLPPESYMGTISGSMSGYLADYMPRLHNRRQRRLKEFALAAAARKNPVPDSIAKMAKEQLPAGSKEFAAAARERHHQTEDLESVATCEPLLMDMNADSQFGQLWIFGMPFFRTYYTSFQFKHVASGPPQAASMSFSVADGECRPGITPSRFLELDHNRTDQAVRVDTDEERAYVWRHWSRAPQRPATMHVRASKIRVPAFKKWHDAAAPLTSHSSSRPVFRV